MSLLGNLVREVTKAVSGVGEAIIHGATDVTEVVTGPNQVTQAVRETGVGLLRSAQTITESVVNVGEQALGIQTQRNTASDPSHDEPADHETQQV